MPTPSKGESRDEFMDRCIPMVMEEDDELSREQAAGKCGGIYDDNKRALSLDDITELVSLAWMSGPGDYGGKMEYSWVLHVYPKNVIIKRSGQYYKIPYTMSDGVVQFDTSKAALVEPDYRKMEVRRLVPMPIRAEGGGAPYTYRAYGVLFGSPDSKDLYDTYFDKDTEYHLDWYRRWPWLYDHGANPHIGRDAVGFWEEWEQDDVGIFFRGELDKRNKYVDAIQALIDSEMVFPSQGTAQHLMSVADDGHVDEWAIVEVSSTTSPGNFRQRPLKPEAIRAFRLIGGVDMSDFDTTMGIDVGEEEEQQEPVEEEVEVEEEDGELDIEATFEEVRDALHAIDGVVRDFNSAIEELRRDIEELKKNDAEQLKDVVQGRSFVGDLWSASRESTVRATDDDKPKPPPVTKQGVGSIMGALMTRSLK